MPESVSALLSRAAVGAAWCSMAPARQQVLEGYLEKYRTLAGPQRALDEWLGRSAARLLRAEPNNPDRQRLQHLIDAVT